MKEVDPLSFLKAVYMNAELPLSVRMRAAIELLPFTHPKLAVTAVVSEQDLTKLRLISVGATASAIQQFLGSNQRVGHSRLEGQCPTLAIGSCRG